MVKARKYLHQKVLWGLNEREQRGMESAQTQGSAHRKLNHVGWQRYQWNPEKGEAGMNRDSYRVSRRGMSWAWSGKIMTFFTGQNGGGTLRVLSLLYELPLPHRCSPCASIKCRVIPVRTNYWAASLCPSIIYFSFLSTQPGPRWISPQKGVQ